LWGQRTAGLALGAGRWGVAAVRDAKEREGPLTQTSREQRPTFVRLRGRERIRNRRKMWWRFSRSFGTKGGRSIQVPNAEAIGLFSGIPPGLGQRTGLQCLRGLLAREGESNGNWVMRLERVTLLRPRTAAHQGREFGPSGTPPGCMRIGGRIRGYRRDAPQPPATVSNASGVWWDGKSESAREMVNAFGACHVAAAENGCTPGAGHGFNRWRPIGVRVV